MDHIKIKKERMGQGHVLHIELTYALYPDEDKMEEGPAKQLAESIAISANNSIREALPKALMKRGKR